MAGAHSLTSLVTGASGFLGGHLAEALVRRGEKVRALVRRTSNTAHLQGLGVELVLGDLGDTASLRSAARGVDRVYHCAGLVSDWGTWEAFHAANVTGVANVLEAARDASVARLIHISTTDVYGYPDRPADETAPHIKRGWPYGDTKIDGERLVWDFSRRSGLPVTVIRPDSIYGPRSTSFVVEIVSLLRKGSMMHVGRGDQPAGLAYVGNVVDLILLAADSEKSIGQAYNAADGSDVTWRQYVRRLAEIVGVPDPRTTIPYRPAYALGWTMEKVYSLFGVKSRPLITRMAVEIFGTDLGFPVEKARRELGYEPRVGLDEGMRRVESWLRSTGILGAAPLSGAH
ncbi:MAG TPA: NAD-dependent epimerase/dehydratase family protein [Spirochaetia bacterium]|nr:NAD-dependent epimerase/dehydratase family protein [Spirochaetia bacterium]